MFLVIHTHTHTYTGENMVLLPLVVGTYTIYKVNVKLALVQIKQVTLNIQNICSSNKLQQ